MTGMVQYGMLRQSFLNGFMAKSDGCMRVFPGMSAYSVWGLMLLLGVLSSQLAWSKGPVAINQMPSAGHQQPPTTVDGAAEAAAECVILLHGLARSDASMSRMQSSLEEAGYRAINISYPSRQHSIDQLAEKAVAQGLARCDQADTVSFVTHSMGGILVRQYLSLNTIDNLKHVVMLGPPNQGSEVVDQLGDFPGFELFNGPAGMQLGTGEMSVPNKLGPANFSLGIIAGTKTINLMLSQILPKPNDGKVSVNSTRLEGMSDHLAMPVTHTFMMSDKQVIQQVLHFLQAGRFYHPES